MHWFSVDSAAVQIGTVPMLCKLENDSEWKPTSYNMQKKKGLGDCPACRIVLLSYYFVSPLCCQGEIGRPGQKVGHCIIA